MVLLSVVKNAAMKNAFKIQILRGEKMKTENCDYCGYEMEEGVLNECDNCGTLYCEYCSCCED